jgi:hypothetical protein
MIRRSTLALSIPVLAIVFAGCASAPQGGDSAAPSVTSEPTVTATATASSAAAAQAQAWLDAVVLPPGAQRSSVNAGNHHAYTGWPCRPVEQLEAFWTIPGATVSETAEWLRTHPPADLITTATASPEHIEDIEVDSAMIGYIPEVGAQEGIVYSIAKRFDGVAIRAEIAALTESATCPELPDGGRFGAPGQG